MSTSIQHRPISTGDAQLDRLINDYSNAIFACGEWDKEDVEREHATYEACFLAADQASTALFTYLRERLSGSAEGGR